MGPDAGMRLRTRLAFPLGVWLASRAFLFVVAWLALSFGTMREAPGLWQAYPEHAWLDGWLRWDASWYASVADGGYVPPDRVVDGQPRNTAFFPLYPLAMRAVQPLTGDPLVAGLVVSNLALLIALIILYALLRSQLDEPVAERALILVAIHPFAFYFSSVYTESLFLAVVVAAFYFARRRRWLLAAVFAALAGLTRVPGFLTAIAVTWQYLQNGSERGRLLDRSAPLLLLGFAGPAAHLAYLSARYGTPLEFLHAQYVEGWARLDHFAPRGFDEWQHWIFLVAAIPLSALAWRTLGSAPAAWGTATGLLSLTKWTSGGRLSVVLFPAAVTLARLLNRPTVFWTVTTLFAALAAYNTTRFALWHWVA